MRMCMRICTHPTAWRTAHPQPDLTPAWQTRMAHHIRKKGVDVAPAFVRLVRAYAFSHSLLS